MANHIGAATMLDRTSDAYAASFDSIRDDVFSRINVP
jgi:hypothetical protein